MVLAEVVGVGGRGGGTAVEEEEDAGRCSRR